MPAQRPLHLYIGWLLIGVAAVLLIASLLHVRWADPLSILALIPASILIGGVFVLPAVITLKRKWGDSAANISGLICLFLFGALTIVSNRLARSLSQLPLDSIVNSLLGLLIALAPLLIALWLHKKLALKIRTLIASRSVQP
jgi:hypothetical protein